jgi:pimeloyl-ACP methyl ester carboxylesterase
MIDLVVLTPGFLGFDHFGGFPYFAQTVGTAIRVALEDIARDNALDLRVVPCATVPAGSLTERQEAFVRTLTRCLDWAEQQSSRPVRLHIVGHSTGGLDAELLTLRKPLGHQFWSEPADRVRRALRSIIAIAAPLAGTSLADAALVQLLATNEMHSFKDVLDWPRMQLERMIKLPTALPELWPELFDLIEGIPPLVKDDAAKLLAGNAWYDPHAVLEFVNNLRTNRKLLHDLRPAEVEATLGIGFDARLERIQRARYLTVARNTTGPSTPAGKLFDFFYGVTARHADDEGLEAVAKGVNERLASGKIPIIGASPELPPLRAASNDAIVNTLRQLPVCAADILETQLDRIAAVVVADHLDVLGYFPTATPFAEEAPNGFLNSGSNFRGREFCALYRSVAHEIAKSIT